METKMNEQYEDLIKRLQYALEKGVSVEAMTPIKDVIHALKQLGQRPILEDNVQQFMDITTNMAKTYAAKNHDYGNSFGQSLDEEGLAASRIRMGDKWNRYKTLSKTNDIEVKDESIEDTLLDLANYAIMTVMWLRNSRCIDGKTSKLIRNLLRKNGPQKL